MLSYKKDGKILNAFEKFVWYLHSTYGTLLQFWKPCFLYIFEAGCLLIFVTEVDVLFVILFEVFLLTQEFSLIWRRNYYLWRALTYARHIRPLSGEGSLTYHTYCDICDNLTIDTCVWQWSCHYQFWRLRPVTTGDRTPITRMRDKRSTTKPLWRYFELRIHLYCTCVVKNASRNSKLNWSSFHLLLLALQ